MNKLVCLRVCARARADVRVYVRACVRACARARASTLHMVLYPCADLAMLSGREGMFIASASTEIVRTGDSIPPLRVLSSFSGTLWEPLLIFCEHQLRTARDIRVNTRAANTRLFAQASTSALLSHPSHCCSLSPARARYFLCYLPGLLTLFFVTCSNSLLRRPTRISWFQGKQLRCIVIASKTLDHAKQQRMANQQGGYRSSSDRVRRRSMGNERSLR